MRSIRIVASLVVVAMVSAIVYGLLSGSFGDDSSTIWSLPWGKVSLIDLYAGLAIFGAWVAYRESSPVRTGVWWIALLTTGNLAAGVYVAWAAVKANNTTELLIGDRPDA